MAIFLFRWQSGESQSFIRLTQIWRFRGLGYIGKIEVAHDGDWASDYAVNYEHPLPTFESRLQKSASALKNIVW